MGRRVVTQVAVVPAVHRVEQGGLDGGRGAEVHLGDERAEHPGPAPGPLQAAPLAQLIGGGLVNDFSE